MSRNPTTRDGPATLRLVLGDQLDPRHSWFARVDEDVLYVLMEVRSETDYVLHHAQKILAIFAALRAFAHTLRQAGHRVRYLAIDDPANRQSLTANLDALLAHHGAGAVEYQQPDEWRLHELLRQWGAARAAAGTAVTAVDSEHFLAPRGAVAECFGARRQWRMETFYRQMRLRHRVLLDADGGPAGGRWNFDADNRRPWHGQPPAPPDWRTGHDRRALWATIVAAGVASFGDPAAEALPWPADRAEALRHLDRFIAEALPHFGAFQDAMHAGQPRLFHSLLSFALNTKMLHPREVIDRAEQAWRQGRVPLAAAEGFIRQILGWREYVRGVYWARMPEYGRLNALGHDRPLPGWFWTGRTRMACLARALGDSLAGAYAHHIQRLMVISNFALLAGLDPAQVHRWYLGVYADAFEWVELPNTLGMGQFADGGLLASKPYVGSAAYIRRMSDYCRGCGYDPRQRTGATACPFNALYWDFHLRQRARLQGNARLAMVYRQLDRMTAEETAALQAQAQGLQRRLEQL